MWYGWTLTDQDHCGFKELKEILSALKPKKIEYPGYEHDSDNYKNCLKEILRCNQSEISAPGPSPYSGSDRLAAGLRLSENELALIGAYLNSIVVGSLNPYLTQEIVAEIGL